MTKKVPPLGVLAASATEQPKWERKSIFPKKELSPLRAVGHSCKAARRKRRPSEAQAPSVLEIAVREKKGAQINCTPFFKFF